MSIKISRIKSLDVIRAVAAISVFLSHFGSIELPKLHQYYLQFQSIFLWCNQGLHWGVIVFVVLSGFSIHMYYCREKSFDKSLYLKRRLLRIYPVLTASIFIGFLVDYCLYDHSLADYVYNFLSNVLLITAIFPLETPFSNTIMHTAIVEVVIYISYPFIFSKFRKNKKIIFLILIFLYLLNFGLVFFQIDPTWVQRNYFGLLLYWWIGAFFAELTFDTKSDLIQFNKYLIGWVPITITYLIYLISSHFVNFVGAHIFKSFLLAIFSGILLFNVVRREIRFENSMKFFGFDRIGSSAYSLYAIHFPIILISNQILKQINIPSIFVYLIILLIVGIITFFTFKFIEKPFHILARKIR
jgi:peptidoglycan/LPS O-acetylase OafA/YrhL